MSGLHSSPRPLLGLSLAESRCQASGSVCFPPSREKFSSVSCSNSCCSSLRPGAFLHFCRKFIRLAMLLSSMLWAQKSLSSLPPLFGASCPPLMMLVATDGESASCPLSWLLLSHTGPRTPTTDVLASGSRTSCRNAWRVVV